MSFHERRSWAERCATNVRKIVWPFSIEPSFFSFRIRIHDPHVFRQAIHNSDEIYMHSHTHTQLQTLFYGYLQSWKKKILEIFEHPNIRLLIVLAITLARKEQINLCTFAIRFGRKCFFFFFADPFGCAHWYVCLLLRPSLRWFISRIEWHLVIGHVLVDCPRLCTIYAIVIPARQTWAQRIIQHTHTHWRS